MWQWMVWVCRDLNSDGALFQQLHMVLHMGSESCSQQTIQIHIDARGYLFHFLGVIVRLEWFIIADNIPEADTQMNYTVKCGFAGDHFATYSPARFRWLLSICS